MFKLKLSGGKHQSGEIIINVNRDKSEIGKIFDSTAHLVNVLSKDQLIKLAKHFCGKRDCCCCSWLSAKIEVFKKKELSRK
jgi:hypothetical protein